MKRHEQRGVALIMAILMVALATILAVSVASDGYMDQRRTGNLMVTDQAYQFALGAEALAAEAFQSDDAKIDSLNEAWATPINLPLDEGIGDIKGHLDDLQGRFNVNNVINTNGQRNDVGVKQFEELLKSLNLNIDYATLTLDWIDDDTNRSFPGGAEDAEYAGQKPPYLAANMPITRTSELMSLIGMKYDEYLTLEPYIAALPPGSKLNVCTASDKVLNSLSLTYKQDWGNSATKGCMAHLSDVKTAYNSDPFFRDKLLADHPDYLIETSTYFRANILVTIGTTELALYSVLNRVTTGPQGTLQVIQRSFGTP